MGTDHIEHDEHGEPEDYIGPHEEVEVHHLGHMEEATSEEAEEYVGPLVVHDLPGKPEGLVQGQR